MAPGRRMQRLTPVAPLAPSAEVGRMVDSSQAEDRKMIRLVRSRRLLYARSNMPVASYYTQVKSLWEEVAKEMGWSVADVRRKWSHIRNSYSRHLRNELHGARTGKGRMVSRWYLADELEFLRDHMATDTRSSPYPSYASSFLEMDLAEQAPSEHVEVKPLGPWLAMGSAPAPAFEPKLEPFAPSEDSSSSHAFGPDETASFFQFFRGLYADYQELGARKQRLFKRQCLHYLHAMLDEEDEQRGAVNLSGSADCEDERERKVDYGAVSILPDE